MGPFAESTSQSSNRMASHGLSRCLLLAVDPNADSVVQRVYEVSEQWLGCEPPLGILPRMDQNDGEAWMQVIYKLAEVERAQEYEQAGYALNRQGEMDLWVLLSIRGNGLGLGSLAVEQPNSLGETLAHLTKAIEQVRQAVWDGLRVRLLTHCVLLSTPAEQAALGKAVQTLATVMDGPLLLLSPINYQHMHLPGEQWLAQAATTLAARLWLELPSHSHLLHEVIGGQVWTAGASVWIAPRQALARWLGLAWCVALVQQLIEDDAGSSGNDSIPELPLPADRILIQDLTSQIPPPTVRKGRTPLRPPLHQMEGYARLLTRQGEQALEEGRRGRQERRGQWTARRAQAWEEYLLQEQSSYLSPPNGWPQVRAYASLLEALSSKALARVVVADEELERQANVVAKAKDACTTAAARLESICAGFPSATPGAWLAALAKPWRWGSWLYSYWFELPEQGRQLQAAWNEHNQQVWQEEILHCMRQLYLILVQEVRTHRDKVAALLSQLDRCRQAASDRQSAIDSAQLVPWNQERRLWLYAICLGDGSEAAWRFLQENPLTNWNHLAVDDLLEHMELFVQPWLTGVEDWTPRQLLAQALPGQALYEWLEQREEDALPLWPEQESTGENTQEWWTGWPRPMGAAPDGEEAETRRVYAEWATQKMQLLETTTGLDGFVLLRWAAIDIALN